MKDNKKDQVSRRKFMAGAGTVATFSIMTPKLAFGTEANSKINIGLIGCGHRGPWLAEFFKQHGGYNIAAAADYFQSQVDAFGNKFNVPANRRFSTLSGYKKMLNSKAVDAVVIESPPFFHPEQAQAAVAAGVHVYLAKPVAVDVPGCKSIEASGAEATKKNLCFIVDFQTRADPFYIEALKKVHSGAIGDFAFGESSYHSGIPWRGQIKYARAAKGNPENRLRAWGLDKVLSGDIITEQNIHTLDVVNWIMKQPPISAAGTGAQKLRDFGNCRDTFCLTFKYPKNVGIAFSSRQFKAYGTKPDGIRNRMFGTKGVLETHYGGKVFIRGKEFYKGGDTSQIFRAGPKKNIADFHKNITEKNYKNTTAAESARSNLITILGRTAAYENREVTWKELMTMTKPLDGKLEGLKA